jgi:hypothetical protein
MRRARELSEIAYEGCARLEVRVLQVEKVGRGDVAAALGLRRVVP